MYASATHATTPHGMPKPYRLGNHPQLLYNAGKWRSARQGMWPDGESE